tara:strand:- start:269 stop:1675 length:1407 start_codon:yes stop_codon:yes gene_type:complete
VSLSERVLASISRQALIPHGGGVLAAVSGGGDSVALLYLLAELSQKGAVSLLGVVHLNHQLRRPSSEHDEDFCGKLASTLGLPFIVEAVDVGDLARVKGISREHAGHVARYDFFERAAGKVGAVAVALGHTIDDQAETFLLRLLRGAGSAGLSGMRPRIGCVIRPLLTVTRAELRQYLTLQQVSFLEDESNADLSIPRNQIRHELLPHLKRYTPTIIEVLAREAEIARADEEWLADVAISQGLNLRTSIEGGVEFNAEGLVALPVAVARRVLRDALVHVAGSETVSFQQIERLRYLAMNRSGGIDLRRCRAECVAGVLRLVTREGRESRLEVPSFAYRLPVPGEVQIPEAGVTLSARLVKAGLACGSNVWASGVATVAVSSLGPLTVRSWQPGDWFRPIGLDGHRKKLQDLFVDRKVERTERARIPVVLDDLDRIIWVVGHGVSNDFRITESAASVLVLKTKPLGDNQ